MKDTPLFSVLIANYNNGEYIDDAIRSIINQRYTNWEIIVVDDCSTDSSLEVLNRYSLDDRIKIFKNECNKGAGFTKNRCIALANGELCGFLDADDELDEKALEIMVSTLSDNIDCSSAYSTHYLCNKDLQVQCVAPYCGPIRRGDFLLVCNGESVVSHFFVFRRASYLETSGTHLDLVKAVDHDLYYLLEEQGEMVYVDLPLYYYRHHDNNISLNQNLNKAFLWDCEVKRRALERRIVNNNMLFINNKKEYFNKYVYLSIFVKSSLMVRVSYFHVFKILFVYSNLKCFPFFQLLKMIFPYRTRVWLAKKIRG